MTPTWTGKGGRASISEKIWVTINSIPQGMFIESRDRSSPVLLVVHGGPGMPDHFLTERYPTGLDQLSLWCGGSNGGPGFLTVPTFRRRR